MRRSGSPKLPSSVNSRNPSSWGSINGRRFYAPLPPGANIARSGGGMLTRAEPPGAEASVARALVARKEGPHDVHAGRDQQQHDRDHEGVEALDPGRPEDDPDDEA